MYITNLLGTMLNAFCIFVVQLNWLLCLIFRLEEYFSRKWDPLIQKVSVILHSTNESLVTLENFIRLPFSGPNLFSFLRVLLI